MSDGDVAFSFHVRLGKRWCGSSKKVGTSVSCTKFMLKNLITAWLRGDVLQIRLEDC